MYWIMSLVAVVGVIGFAIAGILYLTAAGDEDRSKTAKKIVTYAIVGIIIALASLLVVKQIHEQDCYARLGPKGGIRAVLPLHDTATYSTMVTLVNYDGSVTTTAKAVDYYDHQLADFKTRLMSKSGNAG